MGIKSPWNELEKALGILYGLALTILLMDIPYLHRLGIVVTVSRVSVVGVDNYLFTGVFHLDQLILWTILLSIAVLGALLYRERIWYLLTLLSLTGLLLLHFAVNPHILTYTGAIIVVILFIIFTKKKILRDTIWGVLATLTIFELIKIAYLAVKLFTGSYPWFAIPVYVNAVLTYYLWFLIPLVMALIAIYGFLSILTNMGILRRRPRILEALVPLFPWKLSYSRSRNKEEEINRGAGRFSDKYLLVGILFSIAMGVIPYAPTLNPDLHPVNTDWVYYNKWLQDMVEGDYSVLFTRSDRPLYLILLYTVWLVTRVEPRAIAVYHNIFLFPLYTFSVYMLAKRVLGNRAAGYVALVTPFSPIFLSFIYGGFQANLFAISLVYLSLYFLLGSRREALLGSLLFITIMFIHEWTWTQYTFILTGYAVSRIISWRLGKIELEWRDKLLIYVLVAGYAIDLSKNLLFNMYSAVTVTGTAVSALKPMPYLDSIHFYTTIYTGGTLNNPLFYMISLIGLCAMGSPLLGLSITLSLIPVFISWNIFTYRLILNAPFTLLAGYGLCRVRPSTRVMLIVSLLGISLWKLYSIVPELPLTP
ncbi:MAG: hypothetical protein ABWW65_03505 [Thermoprotei archaeon]